MALSVPTQKLTSNAEQAFASMGPGVQTCQDWYRYRLGDALFVAGP